MFVSRRQRQAEERSISFACFIVQREKEFKKQWGVGDSADNADNADSVGNAGNAGNANRQPLTVNRQLPTANR